jgi:hypothetical protein
MLPYDSIFNNNFLLFYNFLIKLIILNYVMRNHTKKRLLMSYTHVIYYTIELVYSCINIKSSFYKIKMSQYSYFNEIQCNVLFLITIV